MTTSSLIDKEPSLFPLVSGRLRTLTVCCAYIVADISVYVYCGTGSAVGGSVCSGTASSGSATASSLGYSVTSGVGSITSSGAVVVSSVCSEILSSVVVAVACSVCSVVVLFTPQPTQIEKSIVASKNPISRFSSVCSLVLVDYLKQLT